MKNEVHVWIAWIEDAKPHADLLIATLSEEEKSRGHRFVNPEYGQRYLLAHSILRNILARYIAHTSSELVFQKGAHGKPYLDGVDLPFNLTHSNECILVAVSNQGDVGVDVEYLQKTQCFDDLVKRFFAQEEQDEYFLYASEQDRRLAFYRGWTRKEAYLKAIGLGLLYPLDQFAVTLKVGKTQALLHNAGDAGVGTKWTLLSLDVGADYLASLAIKAPIGTLQTHTWSFRSS